MSIRNTTEFNHYLCEPYCGREFAAVDATCGNGNDTLWLAERFGRVYAFDIQAEACEKTTELLRSKLDEISGRKNDSAEGEKAAKQETPAICPVSIICDSHEYLEDYLYEEPMNINLIMFNLGYLPGGDKDITTDSSKTIKALEGALRLLAVGGMVSIMLYWGHEAGKEEREAVLDFAKDLDSKEYHVIRTDMMNQQGCPPEILLIEKKK